MLDNATFGLHYMLNAAVEKFHNGANDGVIEFTDLAGNIIYCCALCSANQEANEYMTLHKSMSGEYVHEAPQAGNQRVTLDEELAAGRVKLRGLHDAHHRIHIVAMQTYRTQAHRIFPSFSFCGQAWHADKHERSREEFNARACARCCVRFRWALLYAAQALK